MPHFLYDAISSYSDRPCGQMVDNGLGQMWKDTEYYSAFILELLRKTVRSFVGVVDLQTRFGPRTQIWKNTGYYSAFILELLRKTERIFVGVVHLQPRFGPRTQIRKDTEYYSAFILALLSKTKNLCRCCRSATTIWTQDANVKGFAILSYIYSGVTMENWRNLCGCRSASKVWTQDLSDTKKRFLIV
jgi:hypothetical protein